MKLKMHAYISTLFVFLVGCANAMSKNQTAFEWVASESATDLYPTKIVQGIFYYRGSEMGVFIPSGGTYEGEWGKFISTHVGGDDVRELPDRMSILYYSLAEKQFYKGTFNLPYDKILALFREGVAADKKRPWFRRIMVGTAPGGAVAVWVTGSRTKEVFFGQAEKYDLRYGQAIGVKFKDAADEAEFTDGLLSDILKPEQIAAIKRDGIPFGKWARFRNQYRWNFTTAGIVPIRTGEIPVNYLNGEYRKLTYPFSAEVFNAPAPLPREIGTAAIKNNLPYPYIIHFDEFEVMEAFEKLGANGELVHLEVTPAVTREATTVRAYNDKESIPLKKTRVADI